ncbi:MAG: endonuclease domain-containing protein [Hyphomicrobium sp.]
MRGNQPWKTNRARVLRSNRHSAEDKLWFHLRDRRLGNFKFVRQFPIENYFVDFVCRKERLIIEIDGGTHSTPIEIAQDRERDHTLSALGYKIVRVHNADIYENIEGVLELLLAALERGDD